MEVVGEAAHRRRGRPAGPRTAPSDVVLMDVRMPEIDGIRALGSW